MKGVFCIKCVLGVFKRTFSWRFFLSSILVSVAILLDNAVDLGPMLRAGTGSLYYFFMGSISLGGLYGVYFAPLLCIIPYKQMKELFPDIEHTQNNSFITFCTSVFYGGCVLGFGYLLLFLLLKCGLPVLMPYEMESIIENRATDALLPYQKYFLSGSGLSYFVSALWFGFWAGCLYGGVSVLTYSFSHSYNLALLSPYLGMLWMTYASKFAGIPDLYRLDMWLKMRSIIGSEEETLLWAAFLTLVILLGMYLIYSLRARRMRYGESHSSESNMPDRVETAD